MLKKFPMGCYIYFIEFKGILLSKLKLNKMMCCARGSALIGCSKSGEAWDVKEAGREAALPHRHITSPFY